MPAIPSTGRLLALDWGQTRIGVALSDETRTLATPLATLVRRPGKRFPMPQFLALVAEHRPAAVIVGLPLSLEGAETESSAAARELATLIGARTYLPVELVDERLTTKRALGTIREQGGTTRGRKGDVDALAAAVLLQGFLETLRNRGRPFAERDDGE